MGTDIPKTLVGVWMDGIIQLKRAGFTTQQIIDISVKTSALSEFILQYYNRGDMAFHNIIKNTIEEWFNGIIRLKNEGYTYDEISHLVEDIKNAYYYTEYPHGNEEDMYDDDEDDDDDDDDDDDSGFDPRKFFPRK